MIGRQNSSGNTGSGGGASRKRGNNLSATNSNESLEMEPLVATSTKLSSSSSSSSSGGINVVMNNTGSSTILLEAPSIGSNNDTTTGSTIETLLPLRNRSHSRRNPTLLSSIQSLFTSTTSIKFIVLIVLSLQNSLFTVLRRYSQGIRKETYSKYEVLMMGEIIKLLFSSFMVHRTITVDGNNKHAKNSNRDDTTTTVAYDGHVLIAHLIYLTKQSGKMVGLAIIYGIMNILSFVALRNIGAGTFTIFAQCKILTTAAFSAIILHRHYSTTKWRALISLVFGVLLFSEPIWNNKSTTSTTSEQLITGTSSDNSPMVMIGIVAVLIEVTLSGFASIYFEKVIKLDPLPLTIWERNFQLALGSIPVYVCFILWDGGGSAGFFGGWSILAWIVTILGAAGGLLVALSIKYGDAILKTLATTAAIILSSLLDYHFLDGPLTPIMVIAGVQVIISICNYTFDTTPEPKSTNSTGSNTLNDIKNAVLLKEKSSMDIELQPPTNNIDAADKK